MTLNCRVRKWIKVVGTTSDKYRTTAILYSQGTADFAFMKI